MNLEITLLSYSPTGEGCFYERDGKYYYTDHPSFGRAFTDKISKEEAENPTISSTPQAMHFASFIKSGEKFANKSKLAEFMEKVFIADIERMPADSMARKILEETREDMKKHVSIAQLFKEHRKSKGMSQRQLAAKSGISPTYVSYIETGLRNPDIGILSQVCHAMGTSLASILLEFEIRNYKGDENRKIKMRKAKERIEALFFNNSK